MNNKNTMNVKFPDQDQLDALLNTFSPRTARAFRAFISTLELHLFPEYQTHGAMSDHAIAIPGVASARVFKLSRSWRKDVLSAENFRLTMRHFPDLETLEIFEKLNPIKQQQIWERLSSQSAYSCSDKAYFRLITEVDVPADFFSIDFDTNKISFNEEVIEKLAHRSDELDFSETSMRFANNSAKLFSPTATKIDCMMLLRLIYGEEKIFDMLEYFSDSEIDLCPIEAIAILEDWDNVLKYPADWTANVLGVKHIGTANKH